MHAMQRVRGDPDVAPQRAQAAQAPRRPPEGAPGGGIRGLLTETPLPPPLPP